MEYSNRLHYIRKTIDNRSLKGKNWTALVNLIKTELNRVEGLFLTHFKDVSFLVEAKRRFRRVEVES